MDKTEVLKLANLARISLTETEALKLSGEFESILGYVGEVKEVSGGGTLPEKGNFPLRNVMRNDSDGHESGLYTEVVLSQAPLREKDYLKVKKIL